MLDGKNFPFGRHKNVKKERWKECGKIRIKKEKKLASLEEFSSRFKELRSQKNYHHAADKFSKFF